MEAQRQNKPVVQQCLPLASGMLSVLFSMVYHIQRYGMLRPDWADRFVQHHLDMVGGTAAALAVVGFILSLFAVKRFGGSTLVKAGVAATVVACILWLFQPL